MAISNINIINGITPEYIRLWIFLGEGTKVQIEPKFYLTKQSYLDGDLKINSALPKDIVADILLEIPNSLSDTSRENIHDLVITELGNRGLDVSKLTKIDLS